MRCKTCNYPLWNLKARQCPECGAGFQPAEFEFEVGAVRFLCPHCAQSYYGTTERGHLDPIEFECVGCHQRIHMNQMCVAPTDVSGSIRTSGASMPWLERRSVGVLRAFFHTIGLALVQPGRLMRSVPLSASVGEALAFGAIVALIVAVVGQIAPMLFIGRIFPGGMVPTFSFFYIAFFLTMSVACLLALVLLWPLTAHLVLRWTGTCRHSIDRTFQAFGYGAGANIVSAVPCIGPYVGWIWWMISSILMLREGQKVSAGRALLAVMTLPGMVIVVAGVAWFLMLTWVASSGGMFGGPPGGWSGPAQQTWTLTSQIMQTSWSPSTTQPPSHAIEMLLGNSMLKWQWGAMGGGGGSAPQMFCQPGTKTTEADIPVGSGTLKDFRAASPSSQLKLVAATLDAQPANVIAHRFGDFIFAFHGSSFGVADPNLWIVIMLPDPNINGLPNSSDQIMIGLGDGTVTPISYSQLSSMLQQQNQYRTSVGMAALPDLTTITHASPALASTPADPASQPASN